MTQKNNATHPVRLASLAKPMLIGAGIALILISVFLSGVDHPNPAWGKYWMIKPLIMVPLAGAGGGSLFYIMHYLFGYQGGWKKVLALALSIIGFVIVLWLGTVLGLNGTLWD